MNLEKFKDSVFIQLPLVTWHFDPNDIASIIGYWPKEWVSLKNDISCTHSFNFLYQNQRFLCVLSPSKNRISITIENSIHKEILYKLISNLKLNIDWSKIDEEIKDLDKRRNELMNFKLKLKADLIKTKSNLKQIDSIFELAQRSIERERFISDLKADLLKFNIKCINASFGRREKNIFWSLRFETKEGLYPVDIELPENFSAYSNEAYDYILEKIIQKL